jgi:phenylalanine-4-hydroxylase
MFTELTGDLRSLRNDLHGAARDPSQPPSGAADDWTIPQRWDRFAAEEHAVWDLLFERQQKVLRRRTVRAFQDGLDILRLSRPGIPEFGELNATLGDRTGWQVVAVPGLVPDNIFFDHLRNRRFPAGNFIRLRQQLDYIEEPDVFHDLFGHVPMLADPTVANWVRRLGEYGAEAVESGTVALLARLYWRTVEFGLAREAGELKILGAGIVSSFGESVFSLESPVPERKAFDLSAVLGTPYRSDAFQSLYFIVSDLGELVKLTERRSWRDLIEEFAR